MTGYDVTPEQASHGRVIPDRDLAMVAAQWLIDGYDSPLLREMASLTPRQSLEGEVRLADVLAELGHPVGRVESPYEQRPWRGNWEDIWWAVDRIDRTHSPYASAQFVLEIIGDYEGLWDSGGGEKLMAMLRDDGPGRPGYPVLVLFSGVYVNLMLAGLASEASEPQQRPSLPDGQLVRGEAGRGLLPVANGVIATVMPASPVWVATYVAGEDPTFVARLTGAELAVDGGAAERSQLASLAVGVLDAVGTRMEDNGPPLRQALNQMRMAFVEAKTAAARGENPDATPSMAWFKTRKGRGYGTYDNKSHGTPHPMNSAAFWENRKAFMARHGVEYAGVDEPAPEDAAEREAQARRNLDVAFGVLRDNHAAVDAISDRLLELAASVPEQPEGFHLAGRGAEIFDDPRFTDVDAYPASMWKQPGEKAPKVMPSSAKLRRRPTAVYQRCGPVIWVWSTLSSVVSMPTRPNSWRFASAT